MSSTISSTNSTMADNERFGLGLNLTINSDMGTIVRAMAEPASGPDIRDRIWLQTPIPASFLGITDCRSDDSLSTKRQNTVTTFDFVNKNNVPNLGTLRQTIYSIIQTSIVPQKCVNELLKMNLRLQHEMELCQVILDIPW